MVTLEEIKTYLEPLMPYARMIVVFLIPYYLAIGGFLSGWGLKFLDILPDPITSTPITYYIIAGVIGVVGIILGIITDPERKKKKEE
jgi:hypothetical protein